MNIIFLTMSRITELSTRGIYTDLMRKFRDEGHEVYIVTPRERSMGLPSGLGEINGVHILGIRTLNLQKTNVLEKGLGQILVERQYISGIKKYFPKVTFDLILYSTPPITFANVINFLKVKSPGALSYLLLKDIFPQNAVDMGMINTNGVKGILYRFFRKKEKKLYDASDFIGCMSPANVEYILKHNPDINPERVEVAPNSIELSTTDKNDTDNKAFRMKWGLPLDKIIFVYGGNLGEPQGISFMIDCLEANDKRKDCFFVVIGTGTELPRIKDWYAQRNPDNIMVMDGLPKAEYDEFVSACDVGMIFLDYRFTIPNYPSRLLSYLEHRMPVLCVTDPNTDIGRIAEDNSYGYWCESNSTQAFTAILDKMIHSNRNEMGEKGYAFLKSNYLVENTYNAIISHV